MSRRKAHPSEVTSRFLTAALLLLAAPASSSGPTGDCPGSGCGNRDALYRLAEAPSFSAASGEVYENSRGATRAPSLVAGQTNPAERAAPRLSAPEPRAARAAAVPAPAAKEEKESGGIMGFLSKHKWQIAGSVLGTVAGILLGGGLFGGLLGIGIGLAISFLGPKIFSGKK